jgi:hypothetical protein
VTALATLSLLEAGVPANDPAVVKAVEFLLKLELKKTYVVSLQTQVLARVDAKKYAKQIQTNADWLVAQAIQKNGKFQGWSYPGAGDSGDGSNTHFAIMGLHAAAQVGAKVDAEIWKNIRDMYARMQTRDGGWCYIESSAAQPTLSMTTAALLGLAVATKYDKKAKGPDAAFEKGMVALLGGKLGSGMSVAYDLFTTAELGRALASTEFKSGKKTKAWYREGAEKILQSQQQDGSLKTGERPIDSGQPVITTACGLFVLGPPSKR